MDSEPRDDAYSEIHRVDTVRSIATPPITVRKIVFCSQTKGAEGYAECLAWLQRRTTADLNSRDHYYQIRPVYKES